NASQAAGQATRLSSIPGNGGETAPSPAARVQEPVSPAQTSSPAEVMAEDKLPVPAEKPLKQMLSVEVDKTTWIQVRPDGKHARSVTLHPGEKRDWEAKENMQIVLGSGSGVRMTWNGEPVEVAGKPGKVMRLHLPKSDGD
ncbi:MAG: DUF4115 domain-containing protein, partial [Acidobacteriota bacterium]